VRAVEPEHRTPVSGPGSGALGHRPQVHMRTTGRYAAVRRLAAARAIAVRRALGALVVRHTLRMHAVRPVPIVPEHHPDRVADHGPDQRSKKPEMLPFLRPRLERAERTVGVFAIEHLPVRGTNRARRRLGEERRVGVWPAGDLVAAAGRVIPGDRVGGYVIGAGARHRRLALCAGAERVEKEIQQERRRTMAGGSRHYRASGWVTGRT